MGRLRTEVYMLKQEGLFSPLLAAMMTLGWENVSICSAEETCMLASIGPFIRHVSPFSSVILRCCRLSSEHTMTSRITFNSFSHILPLSMCFKLLFFVKYGK
jgi:hypothetical protein